MLLTGLACNHDVTGGLKLRYKNNLWSTTVVGCTCTRAHSHLLLHGYTYTSQLAGHTTMQTAANSPPQATAPAPEVNFISDSSVTATYIRIYRVSLIAIAHKSP